MAQEFKIEGIGVGDAETGQNKIVPAMTAGSNRIARGGDSVGVLDVLPTNFALTGDNITSINIGEGMASAYGYDIRNSRTQTLSGTPAVATNKFYFVIIDWDMSVIPADFKIRLHDNGTGSQYTPEFTDNLIIMPTGKYSMILYRLEVNTAGTIVSVDNWENFEGRTIGYTDRAVEANNYNPFAGSLQTKFEKIDRKNTEQDTRLDNLGFKKGSTTLPGSVTLTKEGKYAILEGTMDLEHVGWKDCTMDFVSDETFEVRFIDSNYNSGPYSLKFERGSKTIKYYCANTIKNVVIPVRIGFEIQ